MGGMVGQVGQLEGKRQLDGQDGSKTGWVGQLQGFVKVTRLQGYRVTKRLQLVTRICNWLQGFIMVTRICNSYKATMLYIYIKQHVCQSDS